jgi:hypothetical protein
MDKQSFAMECSDAVAVTEEIGPLTSSFKDARSSGLIVPTPPPYQRINWAPRLNGVFVERSALPPGKNERAVMNSNPSGGYISNNRLLILSRCSIISLVTILSGVISLCLIRTGFAHDHRVAAALFPLTLTFALQWAF